MSTASTNVSVKNVLQTSEQFYKLLEELRSWNIVSERLSKDIKEGTIRILTMAHKYIVNHEPEDENNNNNVPIKLPGKVFLLRGLKDSSDIWHKEFLNQNKQFNDLMQMVSSGGKMLASAIANLELKQEAFMEIQSDQEIRLFKFGKQMNILFKNIQENKEKFLRCPKGPLGSCISVRGKTWLKLVETLLQPYLHMFIAANHQDAELLNEMIDQVYGKYVPNCSIDEFRPQVWVTNFEIGIDLAKLSKINAHFTILDAIIIHDHDAVIEKTLWDMLPVGHILLFRTQHEAFPEVSEETVPENCVLGYTLDFFKVYPYPSFRTSKIEPAETEILSYGAGPVALRKCKQEIRECKESVNVIKTNIKTAKANLLKVSDSIHGIKKILFAFKSLIEMIEPKYLE